jgi:hypothetical protein
VGFITIMQTISNYWCDDERSTVHNLKYYPYTQDDMKINDYGFGQIFKEILKQQNETCTSMLWNEVEYREYEFEPMLQAPVNSDNEESSCEDDCVNNVVNEELANTTQQVKPHDEVHEQYDMTYQGLVKNKFMYA